MNYKINALAVGLIRKNIMGVENVQEGGSIVILQHIASAIVEGLEQ